MAFVPALNCDPYEIGREAGCQVCLDFAGIVGAACDVTGVCYTAIDLEADEEAEAQAAWAARCDEEEAAAPAPAPADDDIPF